MANFASPPESRTADAPAARPRETVGDLLKRARIEQGGEIDQIAAALRIRASYLAAIEQARYDRLPGVVYALGFVRTYANHLGLDGDEAVRRFKLESAGLEQRQDLAFPMPLTARSMPGGKVVLVAFVLAVCAYGVWHYISTGERDRPERIAAVPTSLLPPPAPAPATAAVPGQAAPAAAASAPAAEDAAPSPAPVSASPLPPPQAATATNPTAAQPGASLVAPPPPQAAPAPAQTAGLTPPPVPQASAPAKPGPTPAPTAVAANPAPAAAGAPADTDSNAAPAPAPAEQPAPAQAVAAAVPAAAPGATPAAAPPAPRVFGAIDGPSHITLHAVQDCWIQVRDSDPAQTVIAQRTLHAGDTYRVPDKTGLTLRTGNASVLQVLVDNRAAPALGGTVRNVALDPAKLLAGDAVE